MDNAFNKNRLEPWFVTGFIDGEGCFNISIRKDDKWKIGWHVQLSFKIGLHLKDLDFLKCIQSYLKVGGITKQGPHSVQFVISSVKDLAVIIEHFEKYPLITQKRADYELFKQAFHLFELKEHLTYEGLCKIVAIKASMNLGLSEKLISAYPHIVPVSRPIVKTPDQFNPWWVAGFTSA